MDPSLIEQIKYLRDNQKLFFRQIGEKLGLGQKSVSRAYSKTLAKCPKKQTPMKLTPYHSLIAHWFKECPSLKSNQVWERLKERQVDVDEKTVSRFTRTFRVKKAKIHYPLDFLPGEEAQVDWFFARHPILGLLCGFVMILCYSRYAFLHFFPRGSFEFFIEGHLKAFEYFKGIPWSLRYDNLKSVVLKRQPLTYHPSFLEFARHHDFEIRLCNVACANEKGRVERLIRPVRETLLNVLDSCASFQPLNQAALEWLQKRHSKLHRSTGKSPISLFTEEKLKPIRIMPWKNEVVLPPKNATKTGLVIFDSNCYSIPGYLIRERFTLHVTVSQVHIHDSKGKRIATHPRSYKRGQTFLNPLHRTFKQISSEAKRARIFSVIRNLDPVVKNFLDHNLSSGEDPYTSAYLIFKLLPGHARETILSAIRKLTQETNYSVQVLYKLLKRVPDADPVHPQNLTLLDLDYQPRSLEAYQP